MLPERAPTPVAPDAKCHTRAKTAKGHSAVQTERCHEATRIVDGRRDGRPRRSRNTVVDERECESPVEPDDRDRTEDEQIELA